MSKQSIARTKPPQESAAEIEARAAFQVLLSALSNPGQIFTLPASASTTWQSCQQIGLTLLDLETTFFTPDPTLEAALVQSGARALPASQAAYLFFPDQATFAPPTVVQTLAYIEQSSGGIITDPDEGATIIVACRLGEGQLLHLRGPGIEQATQVRVDGLPVEFWQLRATKITYPLGIDIFLVDGAQVVGLPRTTLVELG